MDPVYGQNDLIVFCALENSSFLLWSQFGSNKDYPVAKLTLNFNPGSSFLGSKVSGA